MFFTVFAVEKSKIKVQGAGKDPLPGGQMSDFLNPRMAGSREREQDPSCLIRALILFMCAGHDSKRKDGTVNEKERVPFMGWRGWA